MVFIYILQLEKGKYYIGKTVYPLFRLDLHFNSAGSNWTKKYKPVSVKDILPNCDNYDEDKYTIQFMEKYGINNVRGGSFCEIKLSDTNISTLKQMIRGVSDKCYICGRNDHFANECKNFIVTKDKKSVENEKCDCPTSFMFPHRRKKCTLNKLISYLDDEDDNIDKLIKDEVLPIYQIKTEKNNGACFRCGRHGHYIATCYASSHINGHHLK
jgi:hypothetical protein